MKKSTQTNTVKNLLVKINLEGKGVVNMDSKDQKFIFNSLENSHMKAFHDNISYAKKNFYKNEDGKVSYKLKISSNCIKHEMYKKDIFAQSPNITHHDSILYSYIASPTSLVRGYMFANKEETVKRKSALSMSDAEQTCMAMSQLETFSKSGEKTLNSEDSDKSDNTFFKQETVGEIKYESIGNIDLMALQFASSSQVFDRYSFNPEKFELFKEFLQTKMPNFNSELGYYQIKNSTINIPEYGFMLSNENVLFLVKETLSRFIKLEIKRRGGYASISGLQIKLVTNPTINTFNEKDGWINIKSQKDIDDLNFETEEFYELCDLKKTEEIMEKVKEKVKLLKQKDKDDKIKKDEKKSEQKKKKNEKNISA